MSSRFSSRLWGTFLRTKTCFLENRYAMKVPLLGCRRRRYCPLPFLSSKSVMGRLRPYNMSVGYSCYSVLSVTSSSSSSNSYYSNSCCTANSKTTEKMTGLITKQFQRLPTNVKPKHYQLTLSPNIETFTFDGDVSIDVEVLEQTNKIVLNALELNVESVQINNKQNAINQKGHISYNEEIVTFEFKESILPGCYSLNIVFHGHINDKMRGLYRSKYVNQKGEEAYAVVTQFEATDARRCFPCWDEPALKATFSITLDVPKNLVALSNMPVKTKQDLQGDLIKYHFETTPIMSTYLVAAVIGEYDYVEDRSSDGVLVRVYTPKGKSEQGLFALEVATKVLPYYKQYFSIAYPLPKIDLIAIADFSAGAMENWGLVTYRETTLLVDPQNTSALSKQWIALVVGHELAHQWFGNLVTMEWWTHLWLNEGYASFVEFLCVNYLFPEYDIWTQFINDSYIRALELDSLKSSHPIEVPVGNPSEIDEIFDDISYNKGASIIRMLHHYIGDDDFRKGMNIYLTRHQYQNTFTEDLWQALEEASKKPVGEVMSTWTKQMGFPQVTVSSRPSDKNDGIILSLSQTKYTTDDSDSKENDDYLWLIPISISTSRNPGKEAISLVLKERSTEVFVPDVDPNNDWIKINPGTIDYFRTKYSVEMLEKLMPAIRDQSLPPVDRLGLLDDLFAMVKAGHTSTVEALKFIRAFEDETNYNVWSSINNVLGKLSQLLANTEVQQSYEMYQKEILKKVYQRLGWKSHANETHLDTLLRSLILSRMALLNEPETVNEAKSRFDQHVGKGEVLVADLRSACYKTVLRAGGENEFHTLLNLYQTTELHEEKDRIGRSLGAARKLQLLSLVLNFAMSNEVRPQDKIFVIISVSLHTIGRDIAWEFFKENWFKINEQFSGALLTRLIKYLTENFNTEERLRDVVQFFAEHQVPGAERTIQQSVETIQLNIKWLERDFDTIKKYLN